MKSFITATGLFSLAAAVSASQAPSYGPPTVNIKNGTISGLHSTAYKQDFFLGVPFAQPPLGENRFRIPQSLNTTYSETYAATEYAPECLGYGGDQVGYPRDEDCLYLNVVRPSGYENEDLPVGVWIHGGGLYDGGARDQRYNLSFIVQNSVEIGKPIIGVSIAYRLAAWGFLSSQEVTGSGQTNIGLRDQRLALHWLQENIGAFGGDTDKVTIWGESAGAGSVGWHLTAYNGRDDGLFRAGIMESGNPVNYNSYKTNLEYQPKYESLLNQTGCKNDVDSLACLRKVPTAKFEDLFFNTSLGLGWLPIVDGDFIQRWASIQLAEGNFVKVPIIDGANSEEGTAFGPVPVDSTEQFAGWISNSSRQATVPKHFVPEVLKVYPNTPDYWVPNVDELGNYTYPLPQGSQYRRSAAYWGDAIMIANRRGTVETWAANCIPAYSYRFNTIPAGIPFQTGVTHFQEVAFVFDNTLGLGYNAAHNTTNPFQNKPQAYYDLAGLMSKSWASFIYDMNPNYEVTRPSAAPLWPEYSLSDPQNIVWDANHTTLAYSEPDTFRAEGIRWILDHALVYRR